jgi:hypothetical protein
MKTIGRILIILAVFSAFAGLMIVAVNATGANAPGFDGTPQFRPNAVQDRVRPGGDENRPDRGERGVPDGPRWMFGLIKNMGLLALLVTIIVWPKSVAKKKRKQAVIKSATASNN